MSIETYINDFERLQQKVFKIELPDQIRVYSLLKSADLETSKTELIRAAISKLGYEEMKAQLRKLEDIAVSKVEKNYSQTESIKEEPADTLYIQKNRFCSRGKVAGNQGSNRRDDAASKSSIGSRNRIDQAGGMTKYFICKSILHWAKNCPHQSHANGALYE